MTTELLIRPDEEAAGVTRELDREEALMVGGTVFEALAIDAESAIEAPEGIEDAKFTMSLTRLPGGQTVPDER